MGVNNMKFLKRKVFEILQSYCFLNEVDEVRVSDECIEIWVENELATSFDIINEELRIAFGSDVNYNSEQLEDYLGLLTDLEKCITK